MERHKYFNQIVPTNPQVRCWAIDSCNCSTRFDPQLKRSSGEKAAIIDENLTLSRIIHYIERFDKRELGTATPIFFVREPFLVLNSAQNKLNEATH